MRMLTKPLVLAADRRAVYVGDEAGEPSGEIVLRDLFQGDNSGWLEVSALLDRLGAEKLQAKTESLVAEGWKRIEIATNLPYGNNPKLRRLGCDPAPINDKETAARAAVLAEYRALEEEYPCQDEHSEDIDIRLSELEVAMEAIERRLVIFDPAEDVRAGVLMTLDWDDSLAVHRGYVRPEDEPREQFALQSDGDVDADAMGQGTHTGVSGLQASATSSGGAVITSGGQPIGADHYDQKEDGALKLLSERWVMEPDRPPDVSAARGYRALAGYCTDAPPHEARDWHLPHVRGVRKLPRDLCAPPPRVGSGERPEG